MVAVPIFFDGLMDRTMRKKGLSPANPGRVTRHQSYKRIQWAGRAACLCVARRQGYVLDRSGCQRPPADPLSIDRTEKPGRFASDCANSAGHGAGRGRWAIGRWAVDRQAIGRLQSGGKERIESPLLAPGSGGNGCPAGGWWCSRTDCTGNVLSTGERKNRQI